MLFLFFIEIRLDLHKVTMCSEVGGARGMGDVLGRGKSKNLLMETISREFLQVVGESPIFFSLWEREVLLHTFPS